MVLDISQFTQNVLNEFAEQLTDQVFLFIENDRELMRQYLHTVEGKELDPVNAHIAQAIKRHFGLESKGEKCDTPNSKLIQGYEKFTI